jgi:hypothetical protein
MHEITNSLVKLAKEIGVEFHFNQKKLLLVERKTRGIH